MLVPYVHFGRSNTLYNKPTYSNKRKGRPSKFSKPQQDAPEAYVVLGRPQDMIRACGRNKEGSILNGTLLDMYLQRLSLSRRIGVSTAVAVAHVDAHVRCVKPQPCRKCESIPYYPALRRTISLFYQLISLPFPGVVGAWARSFQPDH